MGPMRRRNPACAYRDCVCRCHWEGKGHHHCHDGRACRDVKCTCNEPLPPAPSIADLFPTVTVKRGGIRFERLDKPILAFDGSRSDDKGVLFIPKEILPDAGVRNEAIRRLCKGLDLPVEVISPPGRAEAIRRYWTEGPGAGKFTPTLIAADVPVPGYRHDDLVRKIADTLDLPAEMLDPSIRKRTTTERKPMYSVRVVIEEEGRPLIDIDITTTRPREGINAAAKAADDAMRAHPDGPTEPEPASDGVFSDERPDRVFQPTPERARF